MPSTDESTAALESLAALLERNEATLLDMGMRPYLMRSALLRVVEDYRAAERARDAEDIRAADAEMGRVLRVTMGRLAEGGIAAAARLTRPPRRVK